MRVHAFILQQSLQSECHHLLQVHPGLPPLVLGTRSGFWHSGLTLGTLRDWIAKTCIYTVAITEPGSPDADDQSPRPARGPFRGPSFIASSAWASHKHQPLNLSLLLVSLHCPLTLLWLDPSNFTQAKILIPLSPMLKHSPSDLQPQSPRQCYNPQNPRHPGHPAFLKKLIFIGL